jgi:hypothetical protein
LHRHWLNWENKASLRKPLDTYMKFYHLSHLNSSCFLIRYSFWLVFGFAFYFPYQNTVNIFLLIWSKQTKPEIRNDSLFCIFGIPYKKFSFE